MSSWIYGAGTASVNQNTTSVTGSTGAFADAIPFDEISFAQGSESTDAEITDNVRYLITAKTDDEHISIYPAFIASNISSKAFIIFRTSISRETPSYLASVFADLHNDLRDLIGYTGADRVVTLDKDASGDEASVVYQANGADLFRHGAIETNEWRLQRWNSGWESIIATNSGKVAIGTVAASQQLDVNADTAAIAVFDTRSYAANRGGSILLQGYDAHSAPERTTWASIQGLGSDGTQGSEDGDLVGKTMRAGTLTEAWRAKNDGTFIAGSFGMTAASPTVATTGMSLLTSGLSFTHSSNEMFKFTSNGNIGRASAFSYIMVMPTGVGTRHGVSMLGYSTTGAWAAMDFSDSAATQCGGIVVDQAAHTTSYGTSSDVRGKPNRELLSPDVSIDVIQRLKIWDFDRDGNVIRGVGVIAQEAYEVLPRMVVPGDNDPTLVPTDPEYRGWTADKSYPVPYLIVAVQNLLDRVAALEAA